MKNNIIIILALLINFSFINVYALEKNNTELYDDSTSVPIELDGQTDIDNKDSINQNNSNTETDDNSIDIKNYQINRRANINVNTENEKTGWVKEEGNIYYYVNNNNKVKGFQTIEGKLYFFSNINYALKSGWQSLDGNIFYLDNNGMVVYGTQTIENRNYVFDNDGYLQGFKYINNQMYYYNPDGTQAKGIQRMAGRYYKFNEITGAFEKFVNQKIVIDVSSHQGDIDWEAVKNSGKIDAVILRIGYGVRWMDSKFLRNVNELNRLGIPYSVYLFSYAENGYEAGLEADNLINIVKNNPVYIASNLFSIYYDLESWYISSTGENSNGISKENYGNMITTFINKVTSALGIKTRIYASKNYIETRFPESMKPYMGWIAQWSSNFTYDGTYEGWQYTDNGSVPGINGPVDMSIFYY